LLTAFGIRVWPEELVGPMGRDFDQPPLYGQIVAGVGVSALLMLVPLFALGTGDPRRPFKKGTQLALLAPIVLVGLLPVAGGSLDIPRTFLTLLVMGCHGMIMLAFFRMCRGRTPVFLGGVVLLYLLIVWLVPLFLEFVRYQFFASRVESQFESKHWTVLGTLSPIGLMITAWSTEPDQPSPWVGVALQLVLAALAWHFGFARKAPMPSPGAAAPTPASTDGASSTGAAGREGN
ncbi:MAG TPA: hypothetical protein VHM90_01910, partial [Phycisphaerae bacterium]|nr:hypothetical protein [Phycisphaerae bacterium]